MADELIARELAAMPAGDYIRLDLQRQSDGSLIGLCTLFAFYLPSRRCEIGYILQRDCWGQGFMHEALLTLLDRGFSVLDLHRVEADIDPRNAGSQRTLDRLGFVREGRLRERWIVSGEVSDMALLGLLRRDGLARGLADGFSDDRRRAPRCRAASAACACLGRPLPQEFVKPEVPYCRQRLGTALVPPLTNAQRPWPRFGCRRPDCKPHATR